MDSTAWRRNIGDEAFDHIVRATGNKPSSEINSDDHDWQVAVVMENDVAAILTGAFEMGFKPPMINPTAVTPTSVKFPYGSVLTASGLLKAWREKGHAFLVLRIEPLLNATRGPLYDYLQQILKAYEEQCGRDQTDPVPVDWYGFVGGRGPVLTLDQFGTPPEPTAQRMQAKGPPPAPTKGQKTKTY